MSIKQHAAYWPVSTLKSRGWTESQLRELLPPPQYRSTGGRRVRYWPKQAVLTAEQTPAFQAAAAARKAHAAAEKADNDAALTAAADFLRSAWDAAALPADPAARLAARFHEAITSQIATVAWAERLTPGQSQSYIEQVLSLNPAQEGEQLFGTLRHFVTAAPWLGRNLSAPAAHRLYAQYASILLAVSEQSITRFRKAQPEANVSRLLAMDGFPAQELLSHPLGYLYSVFYVPRAIRSSLELLMELNPKDEYPEARAMQRHFVLHIGGTNTGKTYAGFQQLKYAGSGIYLAPLRLLALEAQELMLDEGVPCALSTGEEEDWQPGDTHLAATAEKLDIHKRYDVAVIDECQMIADPARGYAWTRAILGILSPEIHLCAAPEAKSLLLRLIQSCGDSYEVINHQRKTPLICMSRPTDLLQLQPGDALITFSKTSVLSTAEELREHGMRAAIVYGALPYSTRRKQVEAFLNGEVDYVVSTDAIGMGLNLPIRRIIFMETEKFDGRERRPLKPEEIQQIAGRAGRYGMYDKGYVGAVQHLEDISAGLHAIVPPLQTAVVGFSDLVLQVDFDLLEVLEVWNRMPTSAPYQKLDISRYLSLIRTIREAGFHLSREQELRAANIPFDETEDALKELFFHFLRMQQRGEAVEAPEPPERQGVTLPELELYCRQLDLYFSFCKTFGCDVDTDALYDERERVAEQINQILLHNLHNNIRFCSQCGAALPLHHVGGLCRSCYQKRTSYAPWRRGRR